MLWLGERWQGAQRSLSQPCPGWKTLRNILCEGSPGQCHAPSGPTSSHLAQADVSRLSALCDSGTLRTSLWLQRGQCPALHLSRVLRGSCYRQ